MPFVKVSPPSHRYRAEDVLYIDVAVHPVDALQVAGRLLAGDEVSLEQLDNDAIAACPDPGTEQGRTAAMDRIHSENARMLCELLNYVTSATGKEVSTDSTFELVPEQDDVDDMDADYGVMLDSFYDERGGSD